MTCRSPSRNLRRSRTGPLSGGSQTSADVRRSVGSGRRLRTLSYDDECFFDYEEDLLYDY